jgi:hypothetical protein
MHVDSPVIKGAVELQILLLVKISDGRGIREDFGKEK